MWLRLFPVLVSLSGSLGLATAAFYGALATAAMLFDRQEIIFWLVGDLPQHPRFGWTSVVIPIFLLVFYLVQRSRLGFWYLRQDEVRLARSYSELRIQTIPGLRSRSEAVEHRFVLALCLCRDSAYADALDLLHGREPGVEGLTLPQPIGAEMAARYRLLQTEILLRQENLIKAHLMLQRRIEGPRSTREALFACSAELAVRKSDKDLYREELGKAEWIRGSVDGEHHMTADEKPARAAITKYVRTSPRLGYTKALATTRFGTTRSEFLWAEAILDALEATAFFKEFPGRHAETLLLRTLLLEKAGLAEEARVCARRAWTMTSDRRSQTLLDNSKSLALRAEKPQVEEQVKET
jgi:hypothetical protein